MEYKEAMQWFHAEVAQAVDNWFTSQCQNPHESYYAYCKPGSLRIAPDAPDASYELVTGERVNKGFSRANAISWLTKYASSASCLPA